MKLYISVSFLMVILHFCLGDLTPVQHHVEKAAKSHHLTKDQLYLYIVSSEFKLKIKCKGDNPFISFNYFRPLWTMHNSLL